MKGIKHCEWKVEFDWMFTNRIIAKPVQDAGLGVGLITKPFKTETIAKKHWKKFARINHIKKWSYV